LLTWPTLANLLRRLTPEQRIQVRDLPLQEPHTEVKYASVTDAHCHLDLLASRLGVGSLGEVMDVDRRLNDSNYIGQVKHVITNCVFPENWHTRAEKVTTEGCTVHPTFGVHPKSATSNKLDREHLEVKMASPACVAVGECGLDETKPRMAAQIEVFQWQLRVAHRLQKPVVLHIRARDTKSNCTLQEKVRLILKAHLNKKHKLYLHSFTGGFEQFTSWQREFPHLLVGFSWLTTQHADFVRLGRCIPLQNVAMETDAPHLSPVPGKPNTPRLMHHQASALAVLKNLPVEVVLEACHRNAVEFFSLLD
jgi:TatD DNase family protein